MFKELLYGLDKAGGFKYWRIATLDLPDCTSQIVVTHGKEGGKMQEQVTTITEGKQGRSIEEQADFEARAKIKKQLDKNYRRSKEELEEIPLLPMLAYDYHDHGHRISYPAYVSDKFDGVRCLATCKVAGEVTLQSRTGQPYSVPHVEEELAEFMEPGDVLDGELYFHGYELEDITSAVKRTDPDKEIAKAEKKHSKSPTEENLAEVEHAKTIKKLRALMQFHVFDIVGKKVITLPFVDRLQALRDYFEERVPKESSIVLTVYNIVVSEEELKNYFHKDAVRRGYEGVMVRNYLGLYESGRRSADLQKYKEFIDAEFKIKSYHFDKDGFIVFEMINDVNSNEFNVILGSEDQKRRWAEIADTLVACYMTIQFQKRYKDSLLPQFPTGKAIREGKVVGGKFIPSM
jgi:DNA ligase-1